MNSPLAYRTMISLSLLSSIALAQQPPAIHEPDSRDMMRLGLRGVYFVPNQGQWSDPGVDYGLRSRGLDVAFRVSALTMHLTRGADSTSCAREEAGPGGASLVGENPFADGGGSSDEPAACERLTLTVTFPGSNEVLPIGAQPQTANFNYFVGGEGRSTASDVPSFAEVIYPNLYDGIDLRVMGNDGVLKYEFHVAPGADYSQIRIAYDGIESLCIDDAGDLHIITSFGTLADAAPVVWQKGGVPASPSRVHEEPVLGVDHEEPLRDSPGSSGNANIPARFELCDDHTYRIVLDGPIDSNRKLIIDPDLDWVYYVGGSQFEEGFAIGSNDSGVVYLAGGTTSTDFGGGIGENHGNWDCFVACVEPSGSLRWMTYLGGSDYDVAYAVAVDPRNNAYITGDTESVDFAGRGNQGFGGSDDAFIAKVNSRGQVLWMNYLGGSDSEEGRAIAVDRAGRAVVTGDTQSADFVGRINEVHGDWDVWVTRIDTDGTIVSTLYCGGSKLDWSSGVALDSESNAIVTGWTHSRDFVGRINADRDSTDAFALKISPSAELQWMTYLGGNWDESGRAVDVDQFDAAIVAGWTGSGDFEGRINSRNGGRDVFVLKLTPAGALEWMTYLGGRHLDQVTGVSVRDVGDIVVAGYTESIDFAGRTNRYHGGEWDTFVASLESGGTPGRMVYLGGSGYDACYGLALDADDQPQVCGTTLSSDFAGRRNEFIGGGDVFIARVTVERRPTLTVQSSCPRGGPILIEWSRCSPGGTVLVLSGHRDFGLVIPRGQRCSGVPLGISSHLRTEAQLDGGVAGKGLIEGEASPRACEQYLQLLDLTSCTTSNVVRIE